MSVSGSRESFSESGRDSGPGLRLEADVSGETGRIEVNAELSLTPEAQQIPVISGSTNIPAVITVKSAAVSDVRGSISSVPRMLNRRVGISRTFVSNQINTRSIPNFSSREFTSREIGAEEQLPVSVEVGSVEFPPSFIPDIGNIEDEIPSVPIVIDVSYIGGTSRFLNPIRRALGTLPSVQLEIPPEAFVSTVNVSQFSCAELFSDVDTRVDELNQRATRLRQRVSDFEGVRGAQVISEIESLGSDIRSGLSRVESEISNIGLPRCQSNLENRLDPVRNQLEGLERIELEGPLDCADFSQFEELSLQQFRTVRSAIRGAEEMATSPQTMTESRLNRILDRVEDSREHVRQNVDEDNPCFEQIMDRLDEAESTSERLLSDVELPEQLSCEAAYSTIDSRLESFENDALSADPPIDRESFEFMVNRADNLIRRVRDEIPSEDQRCKEQFIERINGIISRIGRVGARTRIITAEELSREEITERQEVLQDIEGRLDEIRQAGEGLPSREEFLSERDGLNSPLF